MYGYDTTSAQCTAYTPYADNVIAGFRLRKA
jgi:hypothetical protein